MLDPRSHTILTDRLLDASEVAAMLGVSKSWVYTETRAGRMPHIILGRYRRYRREAVEAWLVQRERGPLAADGARFERGTQVAR